MILKEVNSTAVLQLNNPQANSIGPDFLDELNQKLDEIENGPMNSIFMYAEGKIFSAGLALTTLIDYERNEMQEFMQYFNRTILRLFELPLPLIAGVNGHAIAGGFVLAMQADQVIAADTPGQVALLEAQLGIGLPIEVIESFKYHIHDTTTWYDIAYMAKNYTPEDLVKLNVFHQLTPATSLYDVGLNYCKKFQSKNISAVKQIKNCTKKPYVDRIKKYSEQSLSQWLDTWFSDNAQNLIHEKIKSFSKKGA